MVQGSLGTAWMVDGHRTFFSWSLARNQRNQIVRGPWPGLSCWEGHGVLRTPASGYGQGVWRRELQGALLGTLEVVCTQFDL